MADTIQTLALADKISKDNQTAKAVANQWDRTSDIFRNCNTQSPGFYRFDAAGRRYVQPLASSPIQAAGRLATDTRVDAVSPRYNQALYTAPVYNEVAVAFNFDVGFRLDESNEKAFTNAIADRISAATEGIGAETARQILNADGTGTLQQSGKSECTATASSAGANTMTFTAAGIEEILLKDKLSVGTMIDVWTTGGTTSTAAAPVTQTTVDARAITAIDFTTGVVTYDGAATGFTNTHYVYVSYAGQRTADGSSASVREISGLPLICKEDTTSTVGGLTGATEARWIGNEYSAGAAISLAAITAGMNKVEKRIGFSDSTHGYTDAIEFNALWQSLYNSGNVLAYSDTTKVEARGPVTIPLPNGVVIHKERLARRKEVFIVPKDHMQIVAPSGNGTADGDGPKISWAPVNEFGGHFRWDGNHGFVGMAFFNGDLVIDQRARFLRIHTLS